MKISETNHEIPASPEPFKPANGKLRKYRVEVTNHHGEPLVVYLDVMAYSKGSAIENVKAALQFNATIE